MLGKLAMVDELSLYNHYLVPGGYNPFSSHGRSAPHCQQIAISLRRPSTCLLSVLYPIDPVESPLRRNSSQGFEVSTVIARTWLRRPAADGKTFVVIFKYDFIVGELTSVGVGVGGCGHEVHFSIPQSVHVLTNIISGLPKSR